MRSPNRDCKPWFLDLEDWMRAGAFGFGILIFISLLHSQPLELSGRVVGMNGDAVPDAVVELKNRGVSTRTGADGSFALNGNSSIGPGSGRHIDYRLDPHSLIVDVPFPLEVRMEVVDGDGRLLGATARRLGKGSHILALSEAMSDPGRTAGLYFLRLHLGGQSFTHPFFHSGMGARGSVFAPAYRGGAAAKRSSALDSLRIRKAGYRDLALPIASYTAGALGDLVLTGSADDGSICAKQRMQRTSDGFDVVFCEALFDRPPRVRLPEASASSAYAAMTSDSFVTAVGASYPHAMLSSGDPEMRRYASALYEIRIQNGKVESFRPAVLFADSLFMSPLMGKTFEGLISKRTDANRYELKPSLPVRVRILTERYQGEPDGASGFQVKAVIANLAAPITAADGTCMPSLAGYGSQSPFDPGKDVLLPVGRVPSMHAFGNDELVFTLYVGGVWQGSLMSPKWFFTPLDLVRNALEPSGTYTGVGHGSPGTIPMLNLAPVSGEGAACSR